MIATGEALTYRFTTEALPERDRLAIWREVFGQSIIRLDMEPLSDGPFHCQASLRMLPGAGIATVDASPFLGVRAPQLLADGRDDMGLVVCLKGGASVSQGGEEIEVAQGDAVLLRNAEAGATGFPSEASYISICVPRAVLAPMVSDLDAAIMSAIPAGNEGLRLLTAYISLLQSDRELATPQAQRVVAAHIQDLVALTVGATQDAAASSSGRGLRAARLKAVKADIASHIRQRDLTIAAVAARQRISPSYIRKLFEAEGTSFSRFVLEQRLARAHRLLTDPRYDGWTISAIAFAAGFGDISYFNRCFHRRYGVTPGEIRRASQMQG